MQPLFSWLPTALKAVVNVVSHAEQATHQQDGILSVAVDNCCVLSNRAENDCETSSGETAQYRSADT